MYAINEQIRFDMQLNWMRELERFVSENILPPYRDTFRKYFACGCSFDRMGRVRGGGRPNFTYKQTRARRRTK